VDVSVAPARPGRALERAAYQEGLAVDRAVLVGGDQHDGVARLHLQAARDENRHQHLAALHEGTAALAVELATRQQRRDQVFPFWVDSVYADAGGLGKIAEHRAELDSRRVRFDIRIAVKRLDGLRRHLRRHVEIERQALDGRHVAAAVHLQVAQHRVRDLPDHQRLERAGDGDEQQHRRDADHHQQRGEERAAPVAHQVARGDFEDLTHGARPRRCCFARDARLPA
jgi:hypothetical protein